MDNPVRCLKFRFEESYDILPLSRAKLTKPIANIAKIFTMRIDLRLAKFAIY